MAGSHRGGLPRPRLCVMKISHYCERARWGLDHRGIAYEEVAWAPGPHMALAKRVGAPGTGLPILVLGDRVIQGSDAILSWAGLDEGDPALERRFETVTAPLIRRWFYSGTLHDSGSGVRAVLLRDVPPLQAGLARLGWPAIRRAMTKLMDIRPADLPLMEKDLDQELTWADTLVAEGGALREAPFGRLPITAASLLAPLARPGAMPIYRDVHLSPGIAAAYARWHDRPILAWVRETYDRRRRG